MKDRELIVETLAGLRDEWNSISKQMAWSFRKQEEGECDLLRSLVGIGSITRVQWNLLRKEVNAKRRYLAITKERREAERLVQARRDYMRGYMRGYRIKHKQKEQTT